MDPALAADVKLRRGRELDESGASHFTLPSSSRAEEPEIAYVDTANRKATGAGKAMGTVEWPGEGCRALSL